MKQGPSENASWWHCRQFAARRTSNNMTPPLEEHEAVTSNPSVSRSTPTKEFWVKYYHVIFAHIHTLKSVCLPFICNFLYTPSDILHILTQCLSALASFPQSELVFCSEVPIAAVSRNNAKNCHCLAEPHVRCHTKAEGKILTPPAQYVHQKRRVYPEHVNNDQLQARAALFP